MKSHITHIEIKKASNQKLFWACSLANSMTVNVFDSNFYLFSNNKVVFQKLQDATLGDKFELIYPIEVFLGENQRGYLNIMRIMHPENNDLQLCIPLYLQPQYIDLSRLYAIDQCKMLQTIHEVVVFDFETTGTDTQNDEDVSFGVVGHPDEFYTLIQPTAKGLERNIKSGAIDIHHITNESLSDELRFEDIYPTLCRRLSEKIWIVYNTDFDVNLLDSLCYRHNLPLIPRLGVHCAMKLYSAFAGEPNDKQTGWKRHRLSDACQTMGIDSDGAHNALTDSIMTYKLIKAIAESDVTFRK